MLSLNRTAKGKFTSNEARWKRIMRVLYVIGIIPIIWIALLLAPYTKGGLIEIIKNGSVALNQPFKIVIVENSIRTILIFWLFIYFQSYYMNQLERIIGGEKKMVQPNGARQRN